MKIQHVIPLLLFAGCCIASAQTNSITNGAVHTQRPPIYDESADLMSNAVDSAICSLRKKLEPPGSPQLIHTKRGLGYTLKEKS